MITASASGGVAGVNGGLTAKRLFAAVPATAVVGNSPFNAGAGAGAHLFVPALQIGVSGEISPANTRCTSSAAEIGPCDPPLNAINQVRHYSISSDKG